MAEITPATDEELADLRRVDSKATAFPMGADEILALLALLARLDAAEARVRVLTSALERIAKSSPYRYGTLHPDACAQVARAALDTGGRG